MERDGLLYRRACPSDRRSAYAVVTESGMTRLGETLPGHIQLIQDWFLGQLAPTALDSLLDSLRIVRDAVHPGATAGSLGATAAC
jgi:DNA-binding MarR family transcriptional regulator